MDLGNLADKAKQTISDVKDQVTGAVSDESKTDSILDSVADAAKKVTGGKFDDKIDSARDALDGKLGSE